jgi:outer membrane protein assembly factor BamB
MNFLKAQNTLQWRGLERTGYFPAENFSDKWPEQGPALLLHVESLPASYSSVVVKDDIIYTTGTDDSDEVLTAIDMNGNVLWSTVYGKAWDKSYANARTTPTIVGNKAYMISGNGYLACVDIETGELVWSFDAYTKFEGMCGTWGIAESPLIVDNKMIYTPCGNKTTMVAVDKTSGETIWQSESLGDQSAYCSPVLTKINGVQLIVSVTANYIIGVNADNGEIMWQQNYTDIEKTLTGGDINPVTPLIIGDEIFVTSGYNHVGLMLTMSDDLRSVSVKWKTKDLDVHHGGVVAVDGYIYGSNYTTIRTGNWVCLDWETGELQYDEKWNNKGQIITTGDKLICYEERRGNIALVKANPETFEIISEFKVQHGAGPHWSHPTIYDNKLFLRHGKSLLVYDTEMKAK